MEQYFKLAIANIKENPRASFLIILGTTLAVAMMMVLVLIYQVKTTSYSPVSERHRMLYINIIEGLNKTKGGFRGGGLGYRIVNECFYNMTTPEKIATASSGTSLKLISIPGNSKKRECDVRETDANFWKVFDFKFINGSPYDEVMFNSALPVAIISERIAREFFGSTDVAGQTIQLDFVDFKVQGVVASVSEVVSETYGELWIPFSLNDNIMKSDVVEGIGGNLNVFILAKSTSDFDAIRNEAQSRVATFNAGQKDFFANIWKQPITSFQTMYYFVMGDRVHGTFWGMLMLAILFLVLPILNLIGIRNSQIKKRSPEFGLRKAFGATTYNVMMQLFAENLIITLIGSVIGLFLSIFFFYIAKDSLLERSDVDVQISMILRPTLLIATLLTCLLINILSTAYATWKTAKAEVVESLNANI